MITHIKPKHLIIGLVVLTLICWGSLSYGALQYTPSCTEGDDLCHSAQTVSGDLILSAGFTAGFMVPIWMLTGLLYVLSKYLYKPPVDQTDPKES